MPVQSSTTNKEVIKMVATKLGISNTGDYVLVKIKNGEGERRPTDTVVACSTEALTNLFFFTLQKKSVRMRHASN